MPRLQPPQGYITAKEAKERLGISDAMLHYYVESAKLRRYGPADRKHKFYKAAEVEAVLSARAAGFEDLATRHYRAALQPAQASDMPAIVEISRKIFNINDDGEQISEPISAKTRMAWLAANPETFAVLRDLDSGQIVGYSSILPLPASVIDRFIHDQIEAEDITGADILPFAPGRPIDLYIMALGIDPAYPVAAKHAYGARLVAGLFAFLLDLAGRGVEIRVIWARSHKPDGLRLLRKLGFPQLRPITLGKHLFAVEPAQSGIHVLMRYTDILEQWKRNH